MQKTGIVDYYYWQFQFYISNLKYVSYQREQYS